MNRTKGFSAWLIIPFLSKTSFSCYSATFHRFITESPKHFKLLFTRSLKLVNAVQNDKWDTLKIASYIILCFWRIKSNMTVIILLLLILSVYILFKSFNMFCYRKFSMIKCVEHDKTIMLKKVFLDRALFWIMILFIEVILQIFTHFNT